VEARADVAGARERLCTGLSLIVTVVLFIVVCRPSVGERQQFSDRETNPDHREKTCVYIGMYSAVCVHFNCCRLEISSVNTVHHSREAGSRLRVPSASEHKTACRELIRHMHRPLDQVGK
jgi:hypothetical protein